MTDPKLDDDKKKKNTGVTPTRIAIWVFVGGVGIYFVVSGIVGIASHG
jgi:hypothetical protein